MSPDEILCPDCGYEISSYTEALEAHEGGARCLLCGGELDAEALERALDAWSDDQLLEEGREKAEIEAEVGDEEDLFEGVPDFGDEGEDEEDPLF